MSIWAQVIIGWGGVALLMLVLWFVQRATKNAGIVDIAWSFATGLLGVFFALMGDGADERRYIIAGMAGLWGLRLGFYLTKRVLSEEEDGRYRELRERWGDTFQSKMFAFFQIQAAWAAMFAAPMLIAAQNPADLGIPDYLAIAVFAISIGGESLADRQLSRFKSRPDSKGKVCREGLWRYSRHPNYFFEWIHWWAYVLLAVSGPWWGWLTLFGPAVMLFFLLKVTGIPPTEQRALKSRGDAYRDYQRTTNAFFPGPPKERSATT
jgi:steroid 5-alpha reductase family enzyme